MIHTCLSFMLDNLGKKNHSHAISFEEAVEIF